MTIELIRTKEHDGDWYKILVDGSFKDCIGIYPDKELEAEAKATDIFNFWKLTEGTGRIIIKSEIL